MKMTMTAVQKISLAMIMCVIIGATIGFLIFLNFFPKPIEYRRSPVPVTNLEEEVMRNCMLIAQSRNLYNGPSWVPIDIAENKDAGRIVMWRVDAYRRGKQIVMYFPEQTKAGEDMPQVFSLCTPSQ